MNDSCKVSIIIPIYNVSKWINRGMNYVLNQSFQNFEVLLIDDGSEDNSLSLCKEWEKRDLRVRVFHKDNEGAGAARNFGLQAAKGKYIYFCDIDDYPHPALLETCVNSIEKYDAEFLMFGFVMEDIQNKSVTICSFENAFINNNQDLIPYYLKYVLNYPSGNGYPWNKFYLRSFLDKNDIRFENQKIQQDEVFNLKVYAKLNSAVISSDCLYTYYIYQSGNTRSHFIPDRFDIYLNVIARFKQLHQFWGLHSADIEERLNSKLISNLNICLQFNLFHSECQWSYKQKQHEFSRILSHETINKYILTAKHIGIENSLYNFAYRHHSLFLTWIFFRTFRLLRRIKQLFR